MMGMEESHDEYDVGKSICFVKWLVESQANNRCNRD